MTRSCSSWTARALASAAADTLGTAIVQREVDLEHATDVHRWLLVEPEFELSRLRAERDRMTGIADPAQSGEREWLDGIARSFCV